MPVNKKYIILPLLFLAQACIDPYEPVINEIQEVLVIDGMISDRSGLYQVRVSVSTPYSDPVLNPVGGCVVSVSDDQGNVEFYEESLQEAGVYEAWLDEPFLGVGKSYSLQVVASPDHIYVSDYDTLLSCPPVDSVYYIQEVSGGKDPDDVWQGIQFYNDVRGFDGGTRNYRWKATATWEYFTHYSPQYIRYKGQNIPVTVDTFHTCYMTELINTVYAASTQLLSENNIYKNKLHYVSNQSSRLSKRYSLLVEQHSLTDQAYNYWQKLAAQSANSASLYETQPTSSQGNIYRTNRPDEKVLGYFYATQVQEKRIFVDSKELDFDVSSYFCQLDTLVDNSEFIYDRIYLLISLQPLGPGPPWLYGEQKCFDCTVWGGDYVVPDFW